MQSFMWGRGSASEGRRDSWMASNLGHQGQLLFLNRMSDVHSRHQRQMERNRKMMASRALHASSPDIHTDAFHASSSDTLESYTSSITGCPRLKVTRSVNLHDHAENTSEDPDLAQPSQSKKYSKQRERSKSKDAGSDLPTFLVTMHSVDETLDTDDDSVFPTGTSEHMILLQNPKPGLGKALKDSMRSLTDSSCSHAPCKGEQEQRRISTMSKVSTRTIDHKLPYLSDKEQSSVKRKKWKHMLYICGYLTLVLIFVICIVFVSAKGVFYTQGESAKD